MKQLLNIILMAVVLHFQFAGQLKAQSTSSVHLNRFMSSVKYVHIVDTEFGKYYRSTKINDRALVIRGIQDFLKKYGFEGVTIGSENDAPSHFASRCELALLEPKWFVENEQITSIELNFYSCRKDTVVVSCKKKIPTTETSQLSDDVSRALFRTLGYSKEKFQLESCIPLASNSAGFYENDIQERFMKNGVDHVEGIYESMLSGAGFQREQIALVRSGQKYDVIYLNGAPNHRDWTEGELKGELYPTGNRTIFKASWMDHLKLTKKSIFMNVTDGLITSTQDEEMVWVKVFPTVYDLKAEPSVGLTTGTGFAVNTSGMIVTAYHVIDDRKDIFVRGLGGDFSKSVAAELISMDKKNDIAVLQIRAEVLIPSDIVPIVLDSKMAQLGTEVFVLSFPLTGSMGEEIKLSTGIVNACSGFQGNSSAYQISATVHPGSSGGPVFNNEGKLIGIVNSRFQGSENVTYALKSPYLEQLLKTLPGYSHPKMSQNLSGMKLTQMASQLTPSVFIIESR